MLRKSAISLAVIGVLNATHANALGLGDVQVSSALNQPLKAEIDLLQLRGLDASQIITSLADTDDFYLAGVKPSSILSDIRFKLDISGGNGKIILTTSDPVREPFLNFLIEVNWPSGRLVREYTVLLDPPVFTADDLAPQGMPVAPQVQSQAMVGETSSTVSQPSTSTSTGTLMAGPGKYHVNNDDTLWQIALNTRPDASISPQQMMLAIQQANQNAFFDNNINRLKSGVVLSIPSKEQILATNARESLQEVKRQNSSWKGAPATAATKPDAAKLDTAKAEMAAGTAAPAEDAQLRIVSKTVEETPVETNQAGAVASETSAEASATDQTMASELAAKNEQLEEQLVVTLEGLDKVERDNAEMFERLDRLSEQMESMARLVELKDQQLAQLQTQLAQKQVAPVEPPATTPSTMTDSLPLEMIGGAVAAVLALLAAMYAFIRNRRKKAEEDEDEALVAFNQQDSEDAGEDVVLPAAEQPGLAEFENTDVAALDSAGTDELSTSELDEISIEEDANDPFNMSSDNAESADEFDAISDAELDSALGSDLDMDLKLDEPIAEDSEMEAFSNSLLDDDEYDLSTGLDEADATTDAELGAELDTDFDSDLDALLAEGDDDLGLADPTSAVETPAEIVTDPVNELDSDFGADLDDLLAGDAGASELEGGSDDELLLDEVVAESVEDEVDDNFAEDLDELLAFESPADVEVAELEEDDIPSDDALDLLLSEAGSESSQADSDDDFEVSFDALEGDNDEVVVADGVETDVDHLAIGELPEQMLEVGDVEDEADNEFELPSEQGVDFDSMFDTAEDAAGARFEGLEQEQELGDSFDFPAESAEGVETSELTTGDLDSSSGGASLEFELDDGTDDNADDALDFVVDGVELTPDAVDAEAAAGEAESDLDVLLQQADSEAVVDTPRSALSLEDGLDEAGDAELEAELEQMLEAEDNALALQETDLDGNEINYLDSADEVGTKIDLARAYIDMDDQDGARDILQEVLSEGSAEQIAEANQILESMKG